MKEKIKVLLVDDDIRLGTEVVEQLRAFGKYTVEYLNSAYGVAEAIEAHRPDVLVFDVEIGDANGIEIALQLYKGNPELPIIFISSNHAEDVKAKGVLDAGAVIYLGKPFSVRELATYIDRYVREYKKDFASDNDQIKLFGNVQFDTCNRALIFENRKIRALRPMEYSVFKKLTDNFNQFVSLADLMATAWDGQEEYYNEQSMYNYINRLRRLLKNDSNLEIELYRKLGYKLMVEGD